MREESPKIISHFVPQLFFSKFVGIFEGLYKNSHLNLSMRVALEEKEAVAFNKNAGMVLQMINLELPTNQTAILKIYGDRCYQCAAILKIYGDQNRWISFLTTFHLSSYSGLLSKTYN